MGRVANALVDEELVDRVRLLSPRAVHPRLVVRVIDGPVGTCRKVCEKRGGEGEGRGGGLWIGGL